VLVGQEFIELTRVKKVLQESEERFRQIAENIREVFWMADPGLAKMIYVSPTYEEIWGRKTAELYNNPKSWMDAIHPEDRKRVEENFPLREMGGLLSSIGL
jgi:PAS domain S-box-containing protein